MWPWFFVTYCLVVGKIHRHLRIYCFSKFIRASRFFGVYVKFVLGRASWVKSRCKGCLMREWNILMNVNGNKLPLYVVVSPRLPQVVGRLTLRPLLSHYVYGRVSWRNVYQVHLMDWSFLLHLLKSAFTKVLHINYGLLQDHGLPSPNHRPYRTLRTALHNHSTQLHDNLPCARGPFCDVRFSFSRISMLPRGDVPYL